MEPLIAVFLVTVIADAVTRGLPHVAVGGGARGAARQVGKDARTSAAAWRGKRRERLAEDGPR